MSDQPEYSSLRSALELAPDTSLADLLARLLDTGVVVDAKLTLALADIDLVYVGLRAVLCNADRLTDMAEPSSEPAHVSG